MIDWLKLRCRRRWLQRLERRLIFGIRDSEAALARLQPGSSVSFFGKRELNQLRRSLFDIQDELADIEKRLKPTQAKGAG